MKTLSPKAGEKIKSAADKLIWQGIQQGIQRGKKEGIKEGIEKTKLEMAIELLKANASDDLVMQVTGLSPEQLDELKRKLND